MNKKNIKFILSIAILSICLNNSCKKNNIAVDKDGLIPPRAIGFIDVTSISDPKYILIPVEQNDSIGVDVTIKTVALSSVSEKINVTYSSNTAINGVQYSAPSSVQMQANSYFASIKIKGNYSYYSSGNRDTVKIKIAGTFSEPLYAKDSIFVILERYCPFAIEDFNGVYSNSIVFGTSNLDTLAFQETYTIDSLGLIPSSSPTKATGYIYDLYPGGSGGLAPDPLRVTFDWTKKTDLKVTFDDQYFYTNAAGLPRNAKPSAGKISTFNSCTKTIDLWLDVYYPVTGAAVATNRHIKLQL